jgi:hypothetical protein
MSRHVATSDGKDFRAFLRMRGSYMQHDCNMEGAAPREGCLRLFAGRC